MALAVIRRKQLEGKCGLARSTIYDRINPKSQSYDPDFPKPIELGGGAVGWIESEIDDWLARRILQRGPRGAANMVKPQSGTRRVTNIGRGNR